MDARLIPTLWRTCRVLAHERRLRMLAAVCRRGPATVSALAAAGGLPAHKASECLRQLQARGLLAVRRESRWVFYEARADPLVGHAAPLLATACRAIRRGESTEEMIRAFTAFTHPRRIRIVQVLGGRPARAAELAGACRISLPALERHLAKLARRNLVKRDADGHWRLVRTSAGLRRALLHLVAGTGSVRRPGT